MPTWIIEFQAVSSTFVAFSAVAVAIAGWRVANRQAITARQKLRLDLYPHRLKVYQAAHLAAVSAINFHNESIFFDQATEQFRDILRDARYLFGAQEFDYLENLFSSILQFRRAEIQLRDPNFYNRTNVEGFLKRHESCQKVVFESLKELPERLGPYLRVEEGLITSRTIFPDSFRENNLCE